MAEEKKDYFVAIIDRVKKTTISSGQLSASSHLNAVAILTFYSHDLIAESGSAQADLDIVGVQLV